MKSVLYASHYANLHCLALHNVDEESFRSLLGGKNVLIHLLSIDFLIYV